MLSRFNNSVSSICSLTARKHLSLSSSSMLNDSREDNGMLIIRGERQTLCRFKLVMWYHVLTSNYTLSSIVYWIIFLKLFVVVKCIHTLLVRNSSCKTLSVSLQWCVYLATAGKTTGTRKGGLCSPPVKCWRVLFVVWKQLAQIFILVHLAQFQKLNSW